MYHPNGKISAIGLYSKEKDSLWKYFNEDEILVLEETYYSGMLSGPSRSYFLNGQVSEETLYKNDEKVGEWKQFYENGRILLVKCYYKNDQLNGQYIRYYPDGRREFFGRYKNDLKEGVWTYYLPDGGIDYELEYLNGKLLTELKFEDE